MIFTKLSTIAMVFTFTVAIRNRIPTFYRKIVFKSPSVVFLKQFFYYADHFYVTTKLMGKVLSVEDVSNALNRWKSSGSGDRTKELPTCKVYVNQSYSGVSASKMLQEVLTKSSKEVYRSCKNGFVTLNGTKIYATRKLAEGDVLSIVAERMPNITVEVTEVEQKKNAIYLNRLKNFTNSLLFNDADNEVGMKQPMLQVLYEDDFLAVVYKPAGLHTLQWVGTMKKQFFTLSDVLPLVLTPPRISHHDGMDMIALDRPLPCHRLDARVPGCVLVAKTAGALAALNSQFSDRVVKKEYKAILVGKIDSHSCNMSENNCTLSDDGSVHILQPVGGRSAHTILSITEETSCNVYGTISRVVLSPVTGRKHQLRQHCAWLGCPIMGDDLYHSAAFFPGGPLRRDAIARAEAGEKEKEMDEGDRGDRGTGGEGGGGGHLHDVSMHLPRDAPRVRKGVGLLLMSTSIEFRHPFPSYIASHWTGNASPPGSEQRVAEDCILESVTMDEHSHRVRVRIKELNKYARIFDKASKGALFTAKTQAAIAIP